LHQFEHEACIDLLLCQSPDLLITGHLQQLQFNIRLLLAELPHQCRQQMLIGGTDKTNTQQAELTLGYPLGTLLQALHLRKNLLRALLQGNAGSGQRNLAIVAGKQLYAQLLFQLLNLPG